MNSLTDGAQSETLYIHLAQWYPETGCGIVSGLDDHIIFYMTDEEEIEGVDVHPRVTVDVGHGEEVCHVADGESGLFLDFARHTLFGRFFIVHETAGQVERAFRWVFGSADHQQLAFAVQDKCGG